jgi:hypothetical protein
MKLTKSLIALTSAVAISAAPVFAGSKTFKETVVVQEEVAPWSAALSTGYDSLYMFRGVNVLRDYNNEGNKDKGGNYGDGLFWTDVSATYNFTENDSITAGGWMAWGAGNIGYQEFNARLNYVHTIDNLALGLGYTLYAVFPEANTDSYANELNASVAYNIDLGFMTLTPSTTYYFNLGPDSDIDNPGASGSAVTGSSYLDLRLSGAIPVIGDTVSINPWTAFGLNFNANLEGGEYDAAAGVFTPGQPFYGANNLEFGVAVPWKINDVITLSGYAAYSIAFNDLRGSGTQPTDPNTLWGGAKVTFSF